MKMYTIVILTAVLTEYEVLRTLMNDYKNGIITEELEGAYIYEQFCLDINETNSKIVLGYTEQGNCEAGIHVMDAMQRFRPELFIYVGTCGGIKNVKIGDSVIATNVFDIFRGKEDEKWCSKPIGSGMSASLLGICKSITMSVNRGDLLKEYYILEGNMVHMGDVGSSSMIVSGTNSKTKNMLKKYYANILAVEMEGYGFYKALEQNGNLEGILIRAVTDDATIKNDETDKLIQPKVMKKTGYLVYEILLKYMQRKKKENRNR